MAGPFDSRKKLRDEAQRLHCEFIGTALETCHTFASLAATEYEIGDREAAERCTREAEKAHLTVIRFLSGVMVDEEGQRFERSLKELRETLNELHRRIGQ
jgi:hypothetical protein